jgi:two-component system, chemotaxis family, protein-glutamate methylesterase/glutaminase
MSTDISKVAVIGSSTGGWKEAQTILGSLTLPETTSVVYIPHVHAQDVYDHLLGQGKRVKKIEHGKLLEPGVIYVGIDDEATFGYGRHEDLEGFYGIRKELQIVEVDGTYSFKLRGEVNLYVDSTFIAVADAFGEAAIGLILMGMGDDGAKGIIAIKLKGGTTLSREPIPNMNYSMPYMAIATGDIDHVLPVEEIGLKLEQLLS